MTFLYDTAPPGDGLVVMRCDLWGYNSIGVVSGSEAIAVDPGITPDEIATFRDRLTAAGVRDVHTVVLTHSHHDHIRGWNAFDGARVVAPKVVADKLPEPRRRILAGKSKVDERLGVSDPTFRYPEVDETFDEAHRLSVGDLDVHLELLTGHSNCSSIVVVPALRTILSADYLVSPGLPYCRWEAAPFESAHERLRELVNHHGIDRLVPAHNLILEGRASIDAAIDEELDYFRFLRHEVQRELEAGTPGPQLVRRCARAMAERRGVDLGPRARQDADNARRVLAELEVAREQRS